MRIIRTVYFTDNGEKLIKKLRAVDSDFIFEIREKNQELSDWTKECFELHLPMLFVGSVGIAVRTIASFITDKLSDSPVVVVDELGQHVIPILSGHYGGANSLAIELADLIQAKPVITTATDINNVFAVDVFAKNNGLRVSDKDKIKNVSSKVLKGENITVEERDDAIVIDGLKLYPKRIVLGMGCKKGKSFQELKDFVAEHYDLGELKKNLFAICSIDVKADEMGLVMLAQYFGVQFITYSAEELIKVQGDFSDSSFVNKTVGVGNVCERAALLGAGDEGILIRGKIARDGMTLAEAKRVKIALEW